MLPDYRSKRFCYQFTCSAMFPHKGPISKTFSLYSSNSWKLVILKCFYLQILQSSTLEKWLEFKIEAYWPSKTEQNSILFTPRGLSTNLLSYEKGLLFSRQDWNLHKVRCLYLKYPNYTVTLKNKSNYHSPRYLFGNKSKRSWEIQSNCCALNIKIWLCC